MSKCPLCSNKEPFNVVKGPDLRVYMECSNCKLIFTEPRFFPSAKIEKERYQTHQNGIQYEGYVNFLNQAIEPALPCFNKEMEGLDFGCGPTPTLSVILEQQGFICDNYDPFFFPELPEKTYDFIFATECFEHFFVPAKDIQQIKTLLKPGGFLIVMTEIWKTVEAFTNWYYPKDPTHVSFYHSKTVDYIASKYELDLLPSNNERVFIFKNRTI